MKKASLAVWVFVCVIGIACRAEAQAPEGARKLGDFIAALEHTDASQRLEACRAIGKLGPRAADAVSALEAALVDADPNVQGAAAEALGAIGPAARSAAPSLWKALKSAGYTDDYVPVWYLAGCALGQLGPTIVPDAIAALDDKHSQVCLGACAALHECGPTAKAAVPALIRLLEKDVRGTRQGAMYAFMGIGPEAEPAVPLLIKTLTHDNLHAQYWACRALGQIGPASRPAVPGLIDRLTRATAAVRHNAAAALGDIGPAVGEEGVRALEKALEDRSQPTREDAAIALGKLGPFAASAAPALEKAVVNDTISPRIPAARALWQVTGKTEVAVDALIEDLHDFNLGDEAAEVLVEIGPAAKRAVPALVELLESGDAFQRLFAAQALGGLGPAAQGASAALESAASDADPDIRRAAAEALQRIHPQAPPSPTP
ncbi:MAG: HEAT repeat domain-containing protein [Planctomycetota bacterium]|jgi:HEAT repeat protein